MYRPEYLGKNITKKEYIHMIIGRVRKYIREKGLRKKRLKVIDLKDTPTKVGIKLFEKFNLNFEILEEFSLEDFSVLFYPLEDYLNFCLKYLLFDDLKKLKKIYFPFCRIPREELKLLAEKFDLKYEPKSKEFDWFLERLFKIGPTIKFSWVNGFEFLINKS